MPRINRAIELLAAGQPVYCTTVEELTYEQGVEQAGTWADYLTVDVEHDPFEPGRCSRSCAGWSTAGRPGPAIARRP